MPGHPPASVVPVRRLLVRGANWLGDAVMTTPALQRLREALPASHITLLTHEKLDALWQRHPSFDAILTFAANESPWSVGRRLRAEHFDAALVLPNSPRSALEVWLARIPERIGFARPWRNWLLNRTLPPRLGRVPMRKRSAGEIRRLVLAEGNANFSLRNNLRTTPGSTAHQMHEYLHLAAALGANPEPVSPLLAVAAEEIEAAESKFDLRAVLAGERPVFGLNPGAEYGPAKRWPPQMFLAAAREIQKRTKCLWLLFGGKAEAQMAAGMTAAFGAASCEARNLAGLTSLRELCALLKRCRVLLTNDTGPMHVAAALGTPVVALFGSTSPELTGPGLPGDARHRLLTCAPDCSPCFRRACPIDLRCLTGISVERAVEAVVQASGRVA